MWEGFSVTSVGLIILVCVLVHRLLLSRRTGNLPPSPGLCLPIIGHSYLMRADMRPTLARLRKKCGDVYYMQWGSVPVVILSGYDVIMDAFKKQADLFAGRPKMFVLEKVTRGKGIAMTSGEPWREHRRFTLGTLKDFGMGKTRLDATIQEQAALMVEEIGKHNGEPFDPKDVISAHVANVICSMVFRKQFKHDDPRFKGIIQKFDENIKSAGGIANFFPWAARLPGDPLGVRRMIANSDAVLAYCADIVREHVETYDENCIEDLVSAYIRELKKHEQTNEQTTMSYEYLETLIADLFMAGSETTTTALRWSLVCLTEYPEIQERLYREITSSIGIFRTPSVLDRSSLVYVEAFYMEVLRFCNLTIILGLHATTETATLRGYTIPTDAVIIPDLESVFSDPDIWGDPLVFRPDRFIDEHGKLIKRDEFIAFFIGKRSCVGESLARTELLLFLSSLVQRFRFESPVGEEVSMATTDGVFGLVHAPKPYRIVAVPRGG
ncbi:cytochrome P450 2H1-like [Dreissena polymorpha]|uniref:Cytochrome P450 n=1 Tax=Dreissena polymorpha TaxID=45954 RepID=A0A9D3YZM5_DREPO|nr:cytochrome P450 2H1-like [Dreissena polymorpha]KAH3708021.1 hypothetical protein DPMN_067460 [Dreissena polymorpha]